MINVVGPRVLVKLDTLKKTVKFGDVEFEVVQGDANLEKRQQASVTEGIVCHIGSLAYKDWGDGSPWCQVGDRVVFAKYAGRAVLDPDMQPTDPEQRYVILNDEDVLSVVSNSKGA